LQGREETNSGIADISTFAQIAALRNVRRAVRGPFFGNAAFLGTEFGTVFCFLAVSGGAVAFGPVFRPSRRAGKFHGFARAEDSPSRKLSRSGHAPSPAGIASTLTIAAR